MPRQIIVITGTCQACQKKKRKNNNNKKGKERYREVEEEKEYSVELAKTCLSFQMYMKK